jgi:hypothetical protein
VALHGRPEYVASLDKNFAVHIYGLLVELQLFTKYLNKLL